jgi:hypothetical protein
MDRGGHSQGTGAVNVVTETEQTMSIPYATP